MAEILLNPVAAALVVLCTICFWIGHRVGVKKGKQQLDFTIHVTETSLSDHYEAALERKDKQLAAALELLKIQHEFDA